MFPDSRGRLPGCLSGKLSWLVNVSSQFGHRLTMDADESATSLPKAKLWFDKNTLLVEVINFIKARLADATL